MNYRRRRLILPVFISALPALFAAAGGPPPVTVKEPVAVTGVVEVLNDVLREPFRKSTGGSTSASFFPANFIKFDIPAGKRLIVETISVRARVPASQNVLVEMFTIQGTSLIEAGVHLTVQKQGTFDAWDYLAATQPVTLRVDGTDSPNEISFSVARNGVATAGELNITVSIFGYLVDIPPPSS